MQILNIPLISRIIPRPYLVAPHEEVPALHKAHVDHVEELLAADTVGDILHVRHGVGHSPLLGAHQQAVKVGVDDHRAQALELSDQLGGGGKKDIRGWDSDNGNVTLSLSQTYASERDNS